MCYNVIRRVYFAYLAPELKDIGDIKGDREEEISNKLEKRTAYRLQVIAWVLLALQLLSITSARSPCHLDCRAIRSISAAGIFEQRLVAVLLTFRAGPRVRGRHAHAQDLEGTCDMARIAVKLDEVLHDRR